METTGASKSMPITTDDDIAEESMKVDVADELAEIYKKISKREQEHNLPLVHPNELSGKQEETMAEETLGLVDKLEHTKIESYLQEKKKSYFKDSPAELAKAHSEKICEWTYAFHYFHLREFLLQDSLDSHKFAHRFAGEKFLSLLQPQTLGDDNER